MEVSKLGLLLGPFIQSIKCMSFKFTGELCVKAMKINAKFEAEIDLSVQNWHEEFNKFWHEHLKISKFAL